VTAVCRKDENMKDERKILILLVVVVVVVTSPSDTAYMG